MLVKQNIFFMFEKFQILHLPEAKMRGLACLALCSLLAMSAVAHDVDDDFDRADKSDSCGDSPCGPNCSKPGFLNNAPRKSLPARSHPNASFF